MQELLTERRITAGVLILSVIVLAVGAFLFTARVIWGLAGTQTIVYFRWERGLIIAASCINVMGFVLLEDRLREAGDKVIARLALALCLIAGAVLVVAEMSVLLTGEGAFYNSPIMAYVVLTFVAQSAFGAALVRTGLTAAWAGWVTMVWNVGSLVAMATVFQGDLYVPFLHYVAPLVIGIALLLS